MADVTAPFGFPYPEDTDLVRDGAADIEALATGVNDQLALGFVYVGTRYYTSSGTFAKADPFGDSSFDGAKLRAIRVRMVGGGGGGGGAAATGAGANAVGVSAGSGAFSVSLITDIAGLASSIAVTRGDGGAGGAAGNNAGGTGGTSSFASLVTAPGGGGGAGGPASAASGYLSRALGGAAGTANISFRGAPSESPIYGIAVSSAHSTAGASSSFAGGGAGVSQAQNGQPGASGSGGSGGCNAQSDATGRTGGAGGAGVVIIDVFA